MMPKGVEHLVGLAKENGLNLRENSDDAERR